MERQVTSFGRVPVLRERGIGQRVEVDTSGLFMYFRTQTLRVSSKNKIKKSFRVLTDDYQEITPNHNPRIKLAALPHRLIW